MNHEWLTDGLHIDASAVLAKALEEAGVAYLSVMGGTYESFFLPETIKKSRKPGYMVSLAEAMKKVVKVPLIAAGRISTPDLAESILRDKKADLIGLAHMVWVDPGWPQKPFLFLDMEADLSLYHGYQKHGWSKGR